METFVEPAAEDEQHSKRPRRACTVSAPAATATAATSTPQLKTRAKPTGRVLIIHANGKPYGHGPSISTASDLSAVGTAAVKAKASNRLFDFSCADYEAMRDTGEPYSGDPRVNKCLPLPRPTYTEFINRAKRAKMIDRLDFLYVPAEAPRPPRIDGAKYEVVVWCGVSFRRFTRIWTPERSHFFSDAFQRRALAVLCCHATLAAHPPPGVRASLGSLPLDLMLDIIALTVDKRVDASKEEYDDLDTVTSGAKHLFLPAPGSSGVREALFDAIFGL